MLPGSESGDQVMPPSVVDATSPIKVVPPGLQVKLPPDPDVAEFRLAADAI
jgi:hypothetical protein